MRIQVLNPNLVQFAQRPIHGTSVSLGIITFNDPARANAMTEEMAAAFREVVGEVREARPLSLIVTGAGRTFSAGGDMEMIRRKQQQTAETNRDEMLAFYQSYLGILDLDIPILAAMNGAAIGAGLCFACACDYRIAADIDRNILGFSFAKLGLTPGMGGTLFPRNLVGSARAQEMLVGAENITPRQAKQIGLVDHVVEPEHLMDVSISLAMHLARQRSDIIYSRLNRETRMRALEEEARLQGASFLSKEHRERFPKFMADLQARKNRS